MARIGAQISGLERQLLNSLQESEAAATINSLRLATGKKINKPRDDPSGFVSLSLFEQQLGDVQNAAANVTAASSKVSQAQLTLDQVRTELDSIRSLLVQDVGQALSSSARAANQVKIDTALEAINTLAGTLIDGERLLDGSADFQVSGQNTDQIDDVRVFALGATTRISGQVTQAATQATLSHDVGGATVSADANFTLTGERGEATIDVQASEALTLAQFAERINDQSHATGITATVDGTNIVFTSVDDGSDAQVKITVNSGTFTSGNNTGQDAIATINGQQYTGDGSRFAVSSGGTRANIQFDAGFTGTFSSLDISGGGKTFALSADLSRTATLAIAGVQTARLGGVSGSLDQLGTGKSAGGLGANTAQAIRIVDEALSDLTLIDGNVDGFADHAIASSSALLSNLETDLTSAIDSIDKVDDAEESLLLARNQALADNALAGLSVLQSQRDRVLNLVQQLAGLPAT